MFPASLLLSLTESRLEEKSAQGLSPSDLPDNTLVRAVTGLFEVLEPFCDPESPDKGIHRKLLGYAFVRDVVKGALPLIEGQEENSGYAGFFRSYKNSPFPSNF